MRDNAYRASDSHALGTASAAFGNTRLELSPGQNVEITTSPLRKSDLNIAPTPHYQQIDQIEVAKPVEFDWHCGVAKSLKREAEDLKSRNSKLESQLSLVQDSSIITNGCLGNLSGLSTAAGASQDAVGSSQAFSWSQLSFPKEDRFAEERRNLRARISALEDEHRRLEMAKIRRIANIGERATSSSAEPTSAVTTLQELDLLKKQVDEAMIACGQRERIAVEKESALARLHLEIQESIRFASSEGPRLSAEARCLRENLQSNRLDHDTASEKLRDAEAASARSFTSAKTMRSDCKILAGTRDALMLEEITIRERLAAISRSRLQTNLAITELRESYTRDIDRAQALFRETIRNAEASEEADRAIQVKLSQISRDSFDIPQLRKNLDELSRAHNELSKHENRAIRYQNLQNVEAECDAVASSNKESRERLTVALASLQDLRSSYAARLEVLKDIVKAHSLEHARYPDACANLQRITTEMTSHAEALTCRLREERVFGDSLWKEISAISEAARLARNHPISRRSRGIRGRENLDPISNLPGPTIGRKRSVSR